VERLTKAGILDDRRAAQASARTLVAVRQRGRHRVGRELERLGFSKETASDATQSALADVDERAVLDSVVARNSGAADPSPTPQPIGGSSRHSCAAVFPRHDSRRAATLLAPQQDPREE